MYGLREPNGHSGLTEFGAGVDDGWVEVAGGRTVIVGDGVTRVAEMLPFLGGRRSCVRIVLHNFWPLTVCALHGNTA